MKIIKSTRSGSYSSSIDLYHPIEFAMVATTSSDFTLSHRLERVDRFKFDIRSAFGGRLWRRARVRRGMLNALWLDLDTYGVGVAAGALIFLAFWLTSA